MKKNSILMLAFFMTAISVTSAWAQPSGKKPAATPAKTAEALIENTQVMVKVVAIKDNVVPVDEFTKPDEGNKFVSIQIVLDNTKGQDEWKVKPDKFILKDEEGNVYEAKEEFSSLTQPTLKAGVVDGGDLVKGWISFQVASSLNLRSLKLRYEEAGFISEPTVKSGWIALSAVLK
jgi:hypothetical protein